jgi:hypothetical protein
LLHLPIDKIFDRRTLIFKSMNDDFLQLIRQGLSLQDSRMILRANTETIADLHSRDVVNLGIIPRLLPKSQADP